MKYGICLIKTRPDRWAALTEHAEGLGFESVWCADHLVFPIDMDSPKPFDTAPDGQTGTVVKPPPTLPVLDTTAALSYLAATTTTIKLGTWVHLFGIRHPFVSARAFLTLDRLSNGRAIVGVGSGWLESEWRAAGLPFDSRGRRLDEALAVSKRLWTEEIVAHAGEFYEFEPVSFEPKPIQKPYPPIHVGGESAPALRRVAAHGDGWLPGEHTPETFRVPYDRCRAALDAAGRDVSSIEITIARHPEDPSVVERWEDEFGIARIMLFPGSRATGGNPFQALDDFARRFEVSAAIDDPASPRPA